jgi:hypothetical protein
MRERERESVCVCVCEIEIAFSSETIGELEPRVVCSLSSLFPSIKVEKNRFRRWRLRPLVLTQDSLTSSAMKLLRGVASGEDGNLNRERGRERVYRWNWNSFQIQLPVWGNKRDKSGRWGDCGGDKFGEETLTWNIRRQWTFMSRKAWPLRWAGSITHVSWTLGKIRSEKNDDVDAWESREIR